MKWTSIFSGGSETNSKSQALPHESVIPIRSSSLDEHSEVSASGRSIRYQYLHALERQDFPCLSVVVCLVCQDFPNNIQIRSLQPFANRLRRCFLCSQHDIEWSTAASPQSDTMPPAHHAPQTPGDDQGKVHLERRAPRLLGRRTLLGRPRQAAPAAGGPQHARCHSCCHHLHRTRVSRLLAILISMYRVSFTGYAIVRTRIETTRVASLTDKTTATINGFAYGTDDITLLQCSKPPRYAQTSHDWLSTQSTASFCA